MTSAIFFTLKIVTPKIARTLACYGILSHKNVVFFVFVMVNHRFLLRADMLKSGMPAYRDSGILAPCNCGESQVDLVKLGKKGQVTIPKGILRKLAIPDEAPLVVEASADGAIVLRQAVVFPIEIYSDARVKEFSETAKITLSEEKRVEVALKKRKIKKR